MTALAADLEVQEQEGKLVSMPVVASDIIYKGAMVIVDAAGYVAPAAPTASTFFAGIAYEQADNSSGSAGAINCRVMAKGSFLLTGSGLAQSDVGSLVYVTDDQTISTSQASNAQIVGRITKYVSSTKVWVDILPGGSILGDVVQSAEVALAEGSLMIGNSSGVGAALDASGDGYVVVGNATTATSVAVSGAISLTNAGVTAIGNNQVSIEHLDSGIAPAYFVAYAGSHTTAGGDAAEVISVVGATATDLAFVQLHTEGSSPVTVDAAAAATDAINVTMSADPSTDHVLKYMVLRVAS